MDIQSLPWYGQFLVFLIIGGILFGVFYFVYYSDKQKQIDLIQTEIEGVENEIAKAENMRDKEKMLQEEIDNKKATLDKLMEILPEKKEISKIIKDIQAILSEAKLNIQNWATQAAQQKNEFCMEHPYSITIEGNYHNLGIFFDQLSKLKKIFLVTRLTIRPLTILSNETTINANFTVCTYTSSEPTQIAAGRGGK